MSNPHDRRSSRPTGCDKSNPATQQTPSKASKGALPQLAIIAISSISIWLLLSHGIPKMLFPPPPTTPEPLPAKSGPAMMGPVPRKYTKGPNGLPSNPTVQNGVIVVSQSPEIKALALEYNRIARKNLSSDLDPYPVLQIRIRKALKELRTRSIVLDGDRSLESKYHLFINTYTASMTNTKSADTVDVVYIPPYDANLPQDRITLQMGTRDTARQPLIIKDSNNRLWMDRSRRLTQLDHTHLSLKFLFKLKLPKSPSPISSWEDAMQAANAYRLNEYQNGRGKIVGEEVLPLGGSPTFKWTDPAAKWSYENYYR